MFSSASVIIGYSGASSIFARLRRTLTPIFARNRRRDIVILKKYLKPMCDLWQLRCSMNTQKTSDVAAREGHTARQLFARVSLKFLSRLQGHLFNWLIYPVDAPQRCPAS